MGWRKIANKILVEVAIITLKAAFKWLDINQDGGISKEEINIRAKQVREVIKGL